MLRPRKLKQHRIAKFHHNCANLHFVEVLRLGYGHRMRKAYFECQMDCGCACVRPCDSFRRKLLLGGLKFRWRRPHAFHHLRWSFWTIDFRIFALPANSKHMYWMNKVQLKWTNSNVWVTSPEPENEHPAEMQTIGADSQC